MAAPANSYRRVVDNRDGTFAVYDADSNLLGRFRTRAEAERKAAADRNARKAGGAGWSVVEEADGKFATYYSSGRCDGEYPSRREADAAVARKVRWASGTSPDLGSAGVSPEVGTPKPAPGPAGWKKGTSSWGEPAPTSSAPGPTPTASSPVSGGSPMAFEVGSFGSNADGFVTFDENGKVDRTFSKQADALKHAADRKAAYQARQAAAQSQSPSAPMPAPSPSGTASTRASVPPRSSAAAQAAALGSAPLPVTPRPTQGTSSLGASVPPFSAGSASRGWTFHPSPWGQTGANPGGSAAANPVSPSSSRSGATSPSGRSGVAGAFERAFDASIGKAISGSEQIVTRSFQAWKQGYGGIKSAFAQPGQAFAAGRTAFDRASMGAAVTAAFAAARAKGLGGAALGGVRSAVWGMADSLSGMTGRGKRGGHRSSGRAARVAARTAAKAATARRQQMANIYRNARKRGASVGLSKGVARMGATGFGRGVASAFQAARFGAGHAGISRAFAGGVGGMAGAGLNVGISAATGLADLAFQCVQTVVRMRAFAESVAEGNRGLARYNGGIASAFMEMGVHDFLREMKLGRGTQGTAITAIRATDTMRSDWQDFDILRANLTNRAGGVAAAFAGSIGSDMSRLARFAGPVLDNDPGGVNATGIAAGFLATPGGFVRGAYDAWLNNPNALLSMVFGGFAGAIDTAAGTAAATVAALKTPVADPNLWGIALNQWAKAGPLLKRASPR